MYSSDMFSGMLAGLVLLGAVIGAAIVGIAFWLIPWLWALVKPWLHMVTA